MRQVEDILEPIMSALAADGAVLSVEAVVGPTLRLRLDTTQACAECIVADGAGGDRARSVRTAGADSGTPSNTLRSSAPVRMSISVKDAPAGHREPLDAGDPVEACFEQGWSDGLPVIPPTPARVERMLSDRDPLKVLG